jgi:hypothetical protein
VQQSVYFDMVDGVGPATPGCYVLSMLRSVKVRRCGGAVCVSHLEGMVDRLRFSVGDSVLAVETGDGFLLLCAHGSITTL